MPNINIKFPLVDDKDTNAFLKSTTTTVEAIKSNLYLLLTTEINTRPYNRGYGSNLRKFIFEPNDEKTVSDISAEIKSLVAKRIPKLGINNIEFEQKDNSVSVLIYFTFTDDFYTYSDVIGIEF